LFLDPSRINEHLLSWIESKEDHVSAPNVTAEKSTSAVSSAVRGFIMGMSRGGTTFSMRLMNQHPDVAAFGETAFWGRLWDEPDAETGQYDERQIAQLVKHFGNARLGGPPENSPFYDGKSLKKQLDLAFAGMSNANPRQVFDALAEAVSKTVDKKFVIEKTPHHVHHVDRILEYYPDTRIMVLVRDPYGFMRSYKNQGRQLRDEAHQIFKRLYHPAVCALVWRKYMQTVNQLERRADPRMLIVRLEKLKENKAEFWRMMLQHFDVSLHPFTEEEVNTNSSVKGDGFVELDNADLFWMRMLAGSSIKSYGVPIRPIGFHPFTWLASLLGIIPWLFRNFGVLRKVTRGRMFGYLSKYFTR
jgi:hypothetical protein